MVPIEQIKRDVAIWMDNKVEIPKDGHNFESFSYKIKCLNWTPELGGKDLTEVLAQLGDDQRGFLYDYLPEEVYLEQDWGHNGLVEVLIWFQNPENSETILRAVWEIIKQSNKE